MGSFSNLYASSSPVLIPQHPPQPSFNMHSNRPVFTSPFPNGINSLPPNSPWSTATPSTSTPTSAAGRKRSRDEADLHDEDYFAVQPPAAAAPPEDEEEWEYGPGMTLIKPNKGYIADASSQTGTWVEEKAEEKAQVAAAAAAERPILRAAKSQRLNLTATPTIAEESISNGQLVAPLAVPPVGMNGTYTEPTVDDFTRHLGIGWSSISSDEHIQAAARGWTKFIENHFPITNVIIRLQSRGLASYLVQASEGYFLFGEDLKQGRLVSTNPQQTLANLRGPVPTFDGDVVMEAGETPKAGSVEPVAGSHEMMNEMVGDDFISGAAVVGNGTHTDVDMDMS